MLKEKTFLKDVIATKILKAEECREYLASIIAVVLKMDKKYVMKNLKLLDTEVNQNIHTKDGEVDVIAENDEIIVNIEVNNKNTRQSRLKNGTYIAQLVIKQTMPSKLYQLKPIIQINLNDYDFYGKNEFIYHSILMEEQWHLRRKDSNIDIYDINLDFLSKIDYTNIKKLNERDLKWLLYLFVCKNAKERKELYSKNRMMRKVEKKMEDFMKDFNCLFYYNPDEFHQAEIEELAHEEALKIAPEIAKDMAKDMANDLAKDIAKDIAKDMAQDMAQNMAQNMAKDELIETAKTLLKIGILSNEQIAASTKLSIKEVEKLKSEMN